ncbi:MAG: nucleotidyltransferase domain-containing protein [Burkholderiales bacterium]
MSLAVFGSVARGSMRADSDVDLLLVADHLPDGRMARVREFSRVESLVADVLQEARGIGINTILSPVFKTTEELKRGSLLFLDMIDEAEILYDRGATLRRYLDDFASRLRKMGAERVRSGGGYYWRLKPDLKPGETIVL